MVPSWIEVVVLARAEFQEHPDLAGPSTDLAADLTCSGAGCARNWPLRAREVSIAAAVACGTNDPKAGARACVAVRKISVVQFVLGRASTFATTTLDGSIGATGAVGESVKLAWAIDVVMAFPA